MGLAQIRGRRTGPRLKAGCGVPEHIWSWIAWRAGKGAGLSRAVCVLVSEDAAVRGDTEGNASSEESHH